MYITALAVGHRCDMGSRLAPNLSYLTIYNPTLRPSQPVAEEDEDAEEQVQILFYTSKERAVSRDRMLRQVGLAKALVSFSECANFCYSVSSRLTHGAGC